MTPRRCWPAPLMTLAVLLAPAVAARGEAPKAVNATVAHIRLSGNLEETAPADPGSLGGVVSETFRAKVERIKKAAKDPAVKAVLFEIDGLDVGFAKVDELVQAVEGCRKAGKKTFAYVEAGETRDYLVGLACDDVAMPEAGWLMLTGMRVEVTFFKNLFEKVGVKADLLQVGEFKGAAEPFTLTKLSDANRKQLESILDDDFEHGLVAPIVKHRSRQGFTADKVKQLIDEGPYSAKAAVKAGLIDRVAYLQGYETAIKEILQADTVTVVKDYAKPKAETLDLSSPFALLKLLSPSKPAASNKPKVAVIYATGVITTGKSGLGPLDGTSCGATTMAEAIREAEADKTVKAIVLRIDSPGGSALGSDLIWHELRQCKKPVIASMSDVAGSGGYYIAAGANTIYADPGTLTGSIGVVGGKLTVGGTYEMLGVTTDVIRRGKNSGILSMTEPFSDAERKAMAALMRDVYDQFLDKVLDARKRAGKEMTREQLVGLAGGRVYTGRQAKANGLVDELGTLDDALAAAKKAAGVPEDKELELLQLPKNPGVLEQLFNTLGADAKAARLTAEQRALLDGVPGLRAKLKGVAPLLQLRGEPVWLVAPYAVDRR